MSFVSTNAFLLALTLCVPGLANAQTSGPVAASTTTITATPNPANQGQAVAIVATVVGGNTTPSGQVGLVYQGQTLQSVALVNGVATFNAATAGLGVGSYTVSASYGGDSNYAPSVSNSLSITVGAAIPTTVQLHLTPDPAYVGQPVSLAATVSASAGTPTGTVNFIYQGSVLGSATLTDGFGSLTVPTNTLSPGAYIVTANYLGGGGFAASSSLGAQLSLGQATTQTALVPGSLAVEQPNVGSLTAVVSRTNSNATGVPTGTVTFYNGTQSLVTVPLNAQGTAYAAQSTAGIAVGSFNFSAHYNGDAGDKASTSATVAVQVSGTVPLSVTLNPLANRHAISPYIYGLDFPPSTTYIQNTGETWARWAGDASTGYNWMSGNTNLSNDYFFANYPFNGSGSSYEALYTSSQAFVSGVAGTGAAPFLAIGMIDWVAKDAASYSFSVAKYGAQCQTEPYNTNEGDGKKTDCSTLVTGNSPNDAYYPLLDSPGGSDPANSLYRSQWVAAVAPLFGTGPHIYGIDNEPEIWNDVHWDVHPSATTYAEMRTLMINESANIKQWDPQAIVPEPGSSGWYFYWNDTSFGADKTAHANLDYNPWLLNEILWNDKVTGGRSMDWYDLHAYPDGNPTGYTHAQMQALALRVLRDFWDPTYQGEGGDVNQQYVTSLQPNRTYAFRIPRMTALINSIYPGTPMTFSEWNAALAGETDFSTALVDVDAWGIFGRENLYGSARWTASVTSSPAYNSLLLYRNYDGQGHGFGTTSIQAANNGNPNLFSSYAAMNPAGTQLTLMLVNKDPANTNLVSINQGNFSASSVRTYTLTQNTPSTIVSTAAAAPSGVVTLPPYTAMLIVATGSLQQTPEAEWSLNPAETMVPAGGTVTLAPSITSGTGTITLSSAHQTSLSNPASTTGVTLNITNPSVAPGSNGTIVVTAGNTPGFYQIQATGTDSNGVAVTQQGYIIVQNPAATLTKTGDGQTGLPGGVLSLTAKLNVGSSGGSTTGASIFFTTSAGTLSAREVTTNSAGNANVTLTLPQSAGPVTVTAEGQYGLGHPVAVFTETVQ